MKYFSLLVLLLLIFAACAPLSPPVPGSLTPNLPPQGATPTRWPTATPPPVGPTPVTITEIDRVISVALRVRGSAKTTPEVEVGTTAVLELAFEPQIQAITRRADGSRLSTSLQPWENAPVAQMRFCLGQGASCVPPDQWQPFQALSTREVPVDWLGPRAFRLWAEFRDAQGQVVPAVQDYNLSPQGQAETVRTLLGIVNPATPPEKLPSPVLTALAATRTAFPVSGSVLIEGGRCCAGGTAGSKINLKVEFQASSTAGSIKEMKIQPGGGCIKDPAQLKGEWEPFQPNRSYEAGLALNWVGWWINVQYRDSAGNLSPVYCDDISLEGAPPRPTP
jgi:hypothetical protein